MNACSSLFDDDDDNDDDDDEDDNDDDNDDDLIVSFSWVKGERSTPLFCPIFFSVSFLFLEMTCLEGTTLVLLPRF